MADYLRTTEGDLYEQVFPPKDLAYYLGELLRAPVRDIPTHEDYRREQGEIGLPTEAQASREVGQVPIDYVTTFLGPLMALLTTRTPPVKKPSGWTKPMTSAERLQELQRDLPLRNEPIPGYPGMRVPPIGGPSGRGKTLEEIIEYRAPLDMSDEAIKAVIERYRQQMRAEQAGAPSRPYRAREWPGEER